MFTLRNDPASDDSEFGSGTAGRRNISPFHDPYDSDIGNPNGDTEPHHRAANDLAKQRQKQNEMKCLDNEKSLLSAETLDITRTSSPRCDSKGDGTQSLSRWEIFIYLYILKRFFVCSYITRFKIPNYCQRRVRA